MKKPWESKRLIALTVTLVASIGAFYVDVPVEVIEKMIYAGITAIGGISAQDVAKEIKKPKEE